MTKCRATFTLIHNDIPFMDRTEIYEIIYNIEEGENMFEALNNHLNQAGNEPEESKIITT
jgi:hypothetical protein